MRDSLSSAVYEGTITHTRHDDIRHYFTYKIFMMYLDLSETAILEKLHPLWSFSGKKNLFYFRRRDYLDQKNSSLLDSIKNLIKKKGFSNQVSHVNMITHMRYMGYCYNPVTFYLVYKEKGDDVPLFIIVDINNTPWNERYPYVLKLNDSDKFPVRFNLKKVFHVSPFYPMDLEYDWTFDFQKDKIEINMDTYKQGNRCFNAHLNLKRTELNKQVMTRLFFKYPCVTAKTMLAIYWQASKLFFKKATFYTHPKKIDKEVS